MKWAKIALKELSAIIITSALPLVFGLTLNPEGPFLMLGLFMGLVLILFTAFTYSKGFSKYLSAFLLFFLGGFGAFIIFTDIVITPYSAYLIWFDLVRDGKASGSISFIYLMTIGYFSAFLGGGALKWGFLRTVSLLLFIGSFIIALIFTNVLWISLSFTFLIITGFSFVWIKPKLIHVQGVMHNRGNLVKGAAVILVLSILIVLPFMGAYEPGGSRFIDQRISPGFRELTLNLFPNFPLLYSIPGYGYSFNEKKLGGKPLLSEQPIFTVRGEGGSTIYLRTRVFDIYTDDAWYLSEKVKEAGTDVDENGVSVSHDPKGTPGNNSFVTVRVENEFFSYIPHVLDTERIILYRENEPNLSYAGEKTGYRLKTPLIRGDAVALFKNESDSHKLEEDMKEIYLQIPPNTTDNLQTLSERLAGEDIQSTVRNILDYLKYSYAYSLNPPGPPGETTFLDSFLFEGGSGYCVHFTTAFIVLARLNGIPARYASGFLVNIPRESGEASVSGLLSHAWPEIYDGEAGWRTIEATPPLDPEMYMDPNFYMQFQLFEESLTARQLSTIIGERITPPESAEEEREKKKVTIPVEPIVFGFFVIAIGTVLIMIVLRLRRLGYFTRSPDRRYKYLVRQMVNVNKRRVLTPETIGWLEWKRRVQNQYPVIPHLDGGIKSILEVFYADKPVSASDTKVIRETITEMRRFNQI